MAASERAPGARHPGTSLAAAAAVVAFGFVGSRLLGILRTVAIAHEFGAGTDVSVYTVAFRIPDLIFQVVAGATIGSAFIPVFARVYAGEGEQRAWHLASSVLTLVAAATAVLCLAGLVLAPWLVPLTAPGLGSQTGDRDVLMPQAVQLTRIMLISPFLFAISGVLTGILNARRQFLLPALAPMGYNLSIIFGALVLSRFWGLNGLAIGVVLGALLHFGVQVPGTVRERMRFRLAWDLTGPTREVARLMGPRVLGLGAAQLNFLVTTYFASKVDDNAIARLSFAWVIAQLPLAFFGMSLSTAVFPRLADHAALGEHDELRELVARTLRTILFFTVPAAVGLAFLREPATVLLLQRGAFSADDAAVTAAALGFFCAGIIPQAGIEIHSRGFYALGDTRTPVVFAVGAMVLTAVLSAAFWSPFGVRGLAAAVSLASWAEWGALWVIYRVRVDPNALESAVTGAMFLFAASVMGLVLGVASIGLSSASTFDALIFAAAGSVAGALVYGAVTLLLGLTDAEPLVERAMRLARQIKGS